MYLDKQQIFVLLVSGFKDQVEEMILLKGRVSQIKKREVEFQTGKLSLLY